jgi:hypothetical protein
MLIRISGKAGYEEQEINESDIREFSITNMKTWTNKGTFKAWFKRYHIRLNDGTGHYISPSSFYALKEYLKGKYTSKKYTQFEYKSGYAGERKATDWTYTLTA